MLPPAGVSIRRLTSSDLADFRAALRVYSEAFEQPEEYERNQPDDDYCSALLQKPDFIQLATLQTGEVVGALSAYILQKFEQARSEIYIYDLAVAEPFRRLGIAEALLRSLAPIAEASGASAVFVQADKGDDPPIALYGKLGAAEHVLHFDLDLSE